MDLGVFGALRAQEAGFPRKLALWIGKDELSYMVNLGMHGGRIVDPLWTDCGPSVRTPNIPT